MITENWTAGEGVFPRLTEEYEDDDRTIQEIAAKHRAHPNQVSTWKRQAMDGLGAVLSNGADKARVDDEEEIRDLHAKIGPLAVERDYLTRGLKR